MFSAQAFMEINKRFKNLSYADPFEINGNLGAIAPSIVYKEKRFKVYKDLMVSWLTLVKKYQF